MKEQFNQKIGLLIVLICGSLWGLSGVLGQLLFQSSTISPEWLSSFRMITSGFCILLLISLKKGSYVFRIWQKKRSIFSLFIFSIFGVLAVQYTYFAAVAASNAATATVLQYTYPIFVLIVTSISTQKFPPIYEQIAIIVTCFGIFLIATHGNLHSLNISFIALILGILAALGFVFYTIYPKKLYEQFGITLISGWGFFLGGCILAFFSGCFYTPVSLSVSSISLILSITFFGSLIPFLLYGYGVQILGNVKASLFVTIEPIVSALLTFFLTGQSFSLIDRLHI